MLSPEWIYVAIFLGYDLFLDMSDREKLHWAVEDMSAPWCGNSGWVHDLLWEKHIKFEEFFFKK